MRGFVLLVTAFVGGSDNGGGNDPTAGIADETGNLPGVKLRERWNGEQ